MGEILPLGRIKAFDSLRLLPQIRKKSNEKEVSRMENTNKGSGGRRHIRPEDGKTENTDSKAPSIRQ
jgi:hypothetical protein